MGNRIPRMNGRYLDTSPNWLSLTFASAASAIAASGAVLLLGLVTPDITPVTLVLHLVWAIAISSAVLNLRVRMDGEKRSLLGMIVAVGVGSVWSSLQQWLGYAMYGLLNDPVLVGATMAMDGIGGGVTYLLYQFNVRKSQNQLKQ